jgi:outer membrane protein assembly factor BamB
VSDGKNIYFGTLGRNVYALNATTGALVWDQPVEGAILGNPVLGSDGTLYLGTHAGRVYALNTRDGRELWSVTNTSWVWTGPILDGSTLYYGDAEGLLHSLSIDGSAENWKQQLNGSIIGSPLVMGSTIIVGTEAGTGSENGNLYFISNDGQSVRPITLPGNVGKLYASPISAGVNLLVAPTEGDSTLLALDQTGTILWSFIPPK